MRSDADFFLDGGGTSLDYFAFVSGLEEEFGVQFPNDGGSGLNTVAAISDYIKNTKR
ncbi:MAG: acyl carrier protein [Clostridia bacterium]|nr:acyl carrier protein [Clostridia bacterium]